MKWKAHKTEKLVAFLQAQVGGSGKLLRKVLELNLCRVNGKVERFGSSVVQEGSVVELAPNWKELSSEKKTTTETIYEDDDLLIINKPAGVVCKEGAFGSRRFLVHRLDKMTTGLLILAKNAKTRDALIDLFQQREVEKKYLAIVDGVVKKDSGVQDTFLVKKGSFEGQTIWGSGPKGLPAITYWKVLSRSKNCTLMLCEPVTGRTHQIRVHMAELGHPILTDRQYAKHFRCRSFAARPMLHAHELSFTFNGKEIFATAPMPADMIAFCKHENLNC